MKWTYYNDNAPYCCEWLKNLIAAGLIPVGDVDSRPIQEVQPSDLAGYAQVHLFAGIGGWPLALRLAGWPDDRPISTGSCPCQPFSVAGRRKGVADSRHLWPHFFRLMRACRPPVVMGEQVAGAAGYAWLAGVGSDLEAEGYAWRAVDIPACAVGAPHRRNRIFWLAHCPEQSGREPEHEIGSQSRRDPRADAGRAGARSRGLADGLGPRLAQREGERGDDGEERASAERGGGGDGGLEHPPLDGRREGRPEYGVGSGRDTATGASGATSGLVYSNDAQWRPSKPRGHYDDGAETGWHEGHRDAEGSGGATGGVGDAKEHRERAFDGESDPRGRRQSEAGGSSLHEAWDSWELVGPDPKGKCRRTGKRIRRLVDGDSYRSDGLCPEYEAIPLVTKGEPMRVQKLRALGNAIVIPLAAEVIRAYLERRP